MHGGLLPPVLWALRKCGQDVTEGNNTEEIKTIDLSVRPFNLMPRNGHDH